MALIDPVNPLTAVQRAANRIREDSARLHMAMLHTHQSIYQTLWNTPGVDPQDILDELDTDAASLFVAGSKAVDILLGQNPNCLTEEQYVPQQAPAFNQGGTVTLAP